MISLPEIYSIQPKTVVLSLSTICIDGGSYMFAVQGTNVATCTFTAYSDAGTTCLTVRMPPVHGPTTSGKHTIHNLAVMGNFVYVAWIPGY